MSRHRHGENRAFHGWPAVFRMMAGSCPFRHIGAWRHPATARGSIPRRGILDQQSVQSSICILLQFGAGNRIRQECDTMALLSQMTLPIPPTGGPLACTATGLPGSCGCGCGGAGGGGPEGGGATSGGGGISGGGGNRTFMGIGELRGGGGTSDGGGSGAPANTGAGADPGSGGNGGGSCGCSPTPMPLLPPASVGLPPTSCADSPWSPCAPGVSGMASLPGITPPTPIPLVTLGVQTAL